jgi:type II secretory pathway pseudopilin PulG
MRRCRYGPGRAHRGFAYVMLLAAVAIIGVAAASALALGASMGRREAEEQLLAIGTEFQRALETYAAATPVGQDRRPMSLDDLLRDPRYPGVRRHLREIYVDPLTGRAEWGVLRDVDGRIRGVHSIAPGHPIKQMGFELWQAHFERATSYAGWIFGASESALSR